MLTIRYNNGYNNVWHNLTELKLSVDSNLITEPRPLKMTEPELVVPANTRAQHSSECQRWSDRWPLEQRHRASGAEREHKVKVCAADLPLGAGGELGSRLAGDFGLLLLGLGLVPLLGARLLRWSRLPLLGIRASPTGVGAVVRPRLHLTGHADTAHTHTHSVRHTYRIRKDTPKRFSASLLLGSNQPLIAELLFLNRHCEINL